MTIKRLYGGAAGGEWELFLIENPTHEEMTRAWAARDDLFPPEFPTPTPDVSPVPPTAETKMAEMAEQLNALSGGYNAWTAESLSKVLRAMNENDSAPPVAPSVGELE